MANGSAASWLDLFKLSTLVRRPYLPCITAISQAVITTNTLGLATVSNDLVQLGATRCPEREQPSLIVKPFRVVPQG